MKGLPAIALIFVSSLVAADEPLQIKDFHVGMTKAEFTKLQRYACDAKLYALYSSLCYTVGGSPISNMGAAFDAEQRVSIFRLEFPSENYEAVKAAVAGKFANIKCEQEPVQNRMGAKFTNEICAFDSGSETLALHRFGDKLTTGWLSLGSNKAIQAAKSVESKKKGDI